MFQGLQYDLQKDVGDPKTVNIWTPLMRTARGEVIENEDWCEAVNNGQWEKAKSLTKKSLQQLVKEENINAQDIHGLTALHHAVRGRLHHRDEPYGSKHGSKHGDPSPPSWENPPSIPHGVLAGLQPTHPDPDVVRLLLSHGSNPMIPDKNGWSCLAHATYCGHQQITDILLQGYTPMFQRYIGNQGK